MTHDPKLKANGHCKECDCLTSFERACWYCGGENLDYTYWGRRPVGSVLHQGARLSDVLGPEQTVVELAIPDSI